MGVCSAFGDMRRLLRMTAITEDDAAFHRSSLSFRMECAARSEESRRFTLNYSLRSLISFEMTLLFRRYFGEILHFACGSVQDDAAFHRSSLSFRTECAARSIEYSEQLSF